MKTNPSQMKDKLIYTASLPERIDLFLSRIEPNWSRSYLQKLIGEGRVQVDGNSVLKASFLLRTGNEIQINHPVPFTNLTAQARPLEILYEDENLLAVNKPAGVLTHPNRPGEGESLVQAALHYFPALNQVVYDPKSEISKLRPGVVHRLDKDTSGVILIAKNLAAMHTLAKQFQEHRVNKEYYALVWGGVDKEIRLHNKLGRGTASSGLMSVRQEGAEGREAITLLEPIKSTEQASWLRCLIQTGRTHQIRVHCKFIGHPVLGDKLYSTKPATALSERLQLTRQMLHAYRLAFQPPGQTNKLTLEAPLPADFQTAARALDLL